jgi:hypothetical protein
MSVGVYINEKIYHFGMAYISFKSQGLIEFWSLHVNEFMKIYTLYPSWLYSCL